MKTSFNDKITIGSEISIEILKNNKYTYEEAIEYLFYISKICKLINKDENTFIIKEILNNDLLKNDLLSNNIIDEEKVEKDDFLNNVSFDDILKDIDDSYDDEEDEGLDIFSIRKSLLDYFYVEKYNNDNKLTLKFRNSSLMNQINLTLYFDDCLVTISDDSIIYNIIFNEELQKYHNEITSYLNIIKKRNSFFSYDKELSKSFIYDGISQLIINIYRYISIIESIFAKFSFLLDYYNFDKLYNSILLVNSSEDEFLEEKFNHISYSNLEDDDLLLSASVSELIIVYLLKEEEYTKKEIDRLASLKANNKNVIVIADSKDINESIKEYIDEYIDFKDEDNNQLLYELIIIKHNNISFNRDKNLALLKTKRKIGD